MMAFRTSLIGLSLVLICCSGIAGETSSSTTTTATTTLPTSTVKSTTSAVKDASASSSTIQNTTIATESTTTAHGNITVSPVPVGNLYMHQAHGILMLTAWMVLLSSSLVFARYYRPAWPEKRFMGRPVWFQMHMFLNVFGLILVGIAIVLIFSAVRRIATFTSATSMFVKAHPYMGMSVAGLMFLNAFMSLFRGDPHDSLRPLYNWAHWIVGILCYIVAIVNLFSGLKIGSDFCPKWTIWVMLAWAVFHLCICIILEIHKCKASDIIEKVRSTAYSVIPSGNKENTDEAGPSEKDSLLFAGYVVKKDPDNPLRYMLLLLWSVVTLAFYGVMFWGILTGSVTGI